MTTTAIGHPEARTRSTSAGAEKGTAFVAALAVALLAACGGRSSLAPGPGQGGEGGAAVGGSGVSGSGGAAAAGGGSGGEACLPADEVCNGLDDDCDGATDEGDPGGGEACDPPPGECGAAVLQCVPPGVLSCVPIGSVGETCNEHDDDCNGVIDDPPACTRIVFVTSQYFLGDLGGLEGADDKCQALAAAAGLLGTFKAWLSSSTVDARDRLSHVGKPYVRVDGVLIADDWEDLVDQATVGGSEVIPNPINVTELFGPPPVASPLYADHPFVFTGTLDDGTKDNSNPPSTCSDWHASFGMASVGDANATYGWTAHGGGPLCDDGAPLYCFEQ